MHKPVGPVIITVDGPAGSGKSSICTSVARQLGLTHVNTGALYRAVGFLALNKGIAADHEEQLCHLARQFKSEGHRNPENGDIFFQNRKLNPDIYSEEAGLWASNIATLPELRNELLPIQRAWALDCPGGAILDVRDTGTVVFPDARLKIYLTASPEQRALRRQIQLQSLRPSDPTPGLKALIEDLRKRDIQDSQRQVAPLRQADDAIMLDTSDLNVDQTIKAMIEMIRPIL